MTRSKYIQPFAISLTLLFILSQFTFSTFAGGRIVNVAEMTMVAGRVVHGRVVAVRSGLHPQQPNVSVLFVKIQVIEMLKGAPAPEISFMQYAGGSFSHLPQYRLGEEIMLFLYPESRLGLTSPVGEGQGKFVARNDVRTGRRVLLNEQGNYALFDRIDKARLRTELSLNKAEREMVEQPLTEMREGAEFSAFRSVVRKLTANPKAASLSLQ
ncbi:MAG TPA: hypothetical protein VEF04_12350 [Blastocatellia bacterium]|nr:hypothetical protein [Blastocatellia bacterium]